MMFTYSLTTLSTTPRDQVRLLLEDTTPATPLYQDEEIAWTLSQWPNVYRAASVLATRLAGGRQGIVRKKAGDVEIALDAGHYRALATDYARMAALSAKPVAGGLSISEKASVEQDTDRVEPRFTKDLHTPTESQTDPLNVVVGAS
ncbi:MAG TPA: hypothetical protein VF951_03990 [Streptosporangiaceae bacterium]